MVGVVGLWSIVPILVKQLLHVFDPFTIAFLRSAQGAGFALALLYARGYTVRSISWSRWHVVGGMGIALNYALYALSLSYTTASVGVLVVQVQYVALTLLAVVVLGERVGLGKMGGIGLVLAGIAVVVVGGSDAGALLAPDYMRGNAVMLLSGLGWGVYALANKVLAPRASSGAILAPMMGLGALLIGVLAAASFQLRAVPDAQDLLSLVALGVVGTGLSFTLVSEGMKRLSATLAGDDYHGYAHHPDCAGQPGFGRAAGLVYRGRRCADHRRHIGDGDGRALRALRTVRSSDGSTCA